MRNEPTSAGVAGISCFFRRQSLRVIAGVLLAIVSCAGCEPQSNVDAQHENATAQAAAQPLPVIPLNGPRTTANSTRLDFGGVILNVPNALAGHARALEGQPSTELKVLGLTIPLPEFARRKLGLADPAAPMQTNMLLGFSFWYPDMTLACTGMQCPDAYESNSERFKVYVGSMYYQPKSRAMQIPTPNEMLTRDESWAGKPDLFPTPFQGLLRVNYRRAWLAKHPEDKDYKPLGSAGQRYMQTPDMPYELDMICGSMCRLTLYSKSNGYQQDMTIYRDDEATIAHTDALARAVIHMVDVWSASTSK